MHILSHISSRSMSHNSENHTPGPWCYYQQDQISMSDLYQQARRLALILQSHGIYQGSEERVLVCLSRTPFLVVAHLATFLAGGVFVVIDPKSPAARLQDIAHDSMPCVALVETSIHAELLAPHCTVLHKKNILEQIVGPLSPSEKHSEKENIENDNTLAFDRCPQEAAYIVYTSGTTGKPKGVIIELQALEALLAWHLQAFPAQEQDCMAITASPGFDASIWEIWSTLAAHMSMYICTDDERLDAQMMLATCLKQRITHTFVSTPLLEQLLDLDWSDPAFRLRYVLTGGDRLIHRPGPNIPFQVINNYGPSEGCVVATSGIVKIRNQQNEHIAPDIGIPLPHCKSYILDEQLQPVSKGSKGKLWIGGIGLARGYLNAQDLTSDRFRPNPFESEPGTRIYNTGDIVYECEDGTLCYCGRDDAQVKIDGVRIELADIESVMRLHPHVSQAVAMTIQDPSTGALRLVCSVVAQAESELNIETLRTHAEDRLPHAMVPVAFLIHSRLPLTTNGKIDYTALAHEHQAIFVKNRDKLLMEMNEGKLSSELKELIHIWVDVLGTAVTPDTDLYSCGGSSLAAVRIATQVARRLHKDCKPTHVLVSRTPEKLFELLSTLPTLQNTEDERRSHLPIVQPATHSVTATNHYTTDWFPVTQMQQSLWYLWKTNPTNPFYNIGATFIIDAHLQEHHMYTALSQMILCHPALGTQLRQNVQSLEIEQRVESLSEQVATQQIEVCASVSTVDIALQQAEQAYRQPFNLEKDLLFRCMYIPVSSGQSVFLIVCHHIIADGLSLQILLQDFSRFYTALVAGNSINDQQQEMEIPPADFAQFVAWQEQQATRSETITYWQDLATAIKLCEFPADKDLEAQADHYHGKIFACQSSSDLGELLEVFCKEQQASYFSTLLTCWSIIIACLCRQDEISIGIPFHGRTHPSFDDAVGMFVNVVPVSMSLVQPGQSFVDLVKQQAMNLELALEQGDFSLTRVAALIRQQDGKAMEIVNTTFSEKLLLNLSLPNIHTTFIEIDTGGARFDLSAFFRKQGNSIAGHIEYSSAIFTQETIEALTKTYFQLLFQALAHPEQSWRNLIPTGQVVKADPQQVQEARERAYPLHVLFEQASSRYATLPAVYFQNQEWSYAELNKQANHLAYALYNTGLRQGDPVPLCMDRSAYVIMVLIAILKLGCFYIALDPENPYERNQQILQNLEARLLITDTREEVPVGNWKVYSIAQLLAMGKTAKPIAFPEVEVNNAAYLMFTSGSTGTPKGVLCPHLGASLRVQWQAEQAMLQPGDRVLQKTPYTFDVSVWEIFYPLAVGATLIIAPPGLQRDPQGIASLLQQARVNLCHFVPTMLQIFLDTVNTIDTINTIQTNKFDLSNLRYIHTSGEALPTHLVQRLHACLPSVQILNLYGPTETGIEVTCYTTEKDGIGHVNIGTLLPYVSARVVDQVGRSVPQGFPGELWIGGPSLAIEYYRNPEETNRQFIFQAEDGYNEPLRYYKTGDLVKQRHDGTFDFLGRIDAQIKVRGIRVEPGEIEARITELDQIQEAVVVVGQTTSGQKTLVCFYVPEQPMEQANGNAGKLETSEETRITAQYIKKQLVSRLPSAFIPALFVPLSSLPLNRSGKRDRKSLSLQADQLLQAASLYGRPPTSPMELYVAQVWSQVLKQPTLLADQNFFEIGGDSVKTLQIVHAFTRQGYTFAVRDFFQYSTIAEQASYLEGQQQQFQPPARDDQQQTLQAGGDNQPIVVHNSQLIPLTPLQSVMLLETLKQPQSDAYWQTLAYRIPAGIPISKIEQAWYKVSQAHPPLRTHFTWGGEQTGQIIEEECTVKHCVLDWSALTRTGQTLEAWCQIQLDTLKASKMQKLQQIYCIQNWHSTTDMTPETVLVWQHHHILLDGWSLAQCLQDFFTYLYEDMSEQLPLRPSLYTYFSWLEQSGIEQEGLRFWKQELYGIQPAQTLHFEQVVLDKRQHADFRTQDRSLSPLSARSLANYCQQHHLTASAVVTCLWGLLLRQYQESDEICVGLTFANRPHQLSCAQQLSGMLINTLPVRLQWQPEQTFLHGCQATMEKILQISEYTTLSYSSLLECAGLPGMTELSKSTLVFQNFAGDLHLSSQGAFTADRQASLLLARGTSTDPFSLTLDIQDSVISVRLGWDAKLYPAKKIEGLVGSLNYWLERLDDLDQKPIKQLALVTPAEQRLIRTLLQPSEGAKTYPASWSTGSYLQQIHSQERIAVCDGSTCLSYAELQQQALWLATYLERVHHIGVGDTVAWIGKRSTEAVVAICATWLLGAAWCAIDPDFPTERQTRTLHTLNPKATLSLHSIPNYIADEQEKNRHNQQENTTQHITHQKLLTAAMQPEQIAYYISTSGSTGQPKLVALQAGGLTSVINAWQQCYDLTSPQSVLQIGSWTSDVFLGDFLKALVSGGTLYICPDDQRISMTYLAKLLEKQSITFVESTPALISALLRHLAKAAARPSSLKTIIVGADIFRLEELDTLQSLLWDGVQLYNGYGLSECTIESIVLPCEQKQKLLSRSGLCPLGLPLPGNILHIVNACGDDLPPGAIGELYIGGAQVAKGYVTAEGSGNDERFLTLNNQRYFKTGDLVRLNEDGILEFFGRKDNQIKIRGYRVELGEVENVLLRQPGIREVAVVPVASSDGLTLIAFLAGLHSAEEIHLLAALRDQLPAYAIPQRIVVLPQLPRNSNGKIDRVALNAHATHLLQEEERQQKLSLEEEYRHKTDALQTTQSEPERIQMILRNIWQSLLKRPVPSNRSFFDLGGHSLLVLQLFERMKEQLPEYEFQIADLFRLPTIERFTAELLRGKDHIHIEEQSKPQSQQKSGQSPDIQQKDTSSMLDLLQRIQRGEVSPEEALRLL